MTQEEIINKLTKLEYEQKALKLEVQTLENRIKDLEEGSMGTGVYFEGCPDYAKDYILKESEGE